MAHGLRTINNQGYRPYGNGRDWFFIGDESYRNGARTPLPGEKPAFRDSAPPPGPKIKLSNQGAAPAEMRRFKARFKESRSVGQLQLERWRKHEAAPIALEGLGSSVPHWKRQESIPRHQEGTAKDLPYIVEAPTVMTLGGSLGQWNEFQSTSSAHGRTLVFDGMRHAPMMDKYSAFSTPINDKARFKFVDDFGDNPIQACRKVRRRPV